MDTDAQRQLEALVSNLYVCWHDACVLFHERDIFAALNAACLAEGDEI